MKLLIATSNPGKLAEIKLFLGKLPVEVVSLKDVGIAADADENGSTFRENAVIKARYYSQKSGLPTIADDGGFEIDALNGEPGVKSHRWIHGDREDTDEELITYTMEKMKKIPLYKRGAQLHAVIAFYHPNGMIKTVEKIVRGIVPQKPSDRRTSGFPFRSLLFIPEIYKFYDHDLMTPKEQEKYNHRKHALDELKPAVLKILTAT
jgi:XTP/dITP diphosphohydrolase